jgi:hypothetical protein
MTENAGLTNGLAIQVSHLHKTVQDSSGSLEILKDIHFNVMQENRWRLLVLPAPASPRCSAFWRDWICQVVVR